MMRIEKPPINNAYSEHDSDNENSRRKLVREWTIAPTQIVEYPAGTYSDQDGNEYHYDEGKRLLIQGKEVMDTCEAPWAIETVNDAFIQLGLRQTPVRVLERGWGLGIAATRIIQKLVPTGGTYCGIELNHEVADDARRWKTNQEHGLSRMSKAQIGIRPQIDIRIIEGDAYEETKKLAQNDNKFEIIISDTFPLDENEKGINDLQDLETLKQLLTPDGVFTFFAYFPGSTGGVIKIQENQILRHFKEYKLRQIPINPPNHYRYLQTDNGNPILSLPIVLCKSPIQHTQIEK